MKILVMAPKGKMGSKVVKSVLENKNTELIGAVAPKGRDYIRDDVGIVSTLGKQLNIYVSDNLEKNINECDCIIDFTNPHTSMKVFNLAKKYNKSVVCGTTGFSLEQINEIKSISKYIPIVLAANTSMVVNLMYELIDVACKAIGSMSDIEIIEMHDKYKKDAPSGTSIELGEILAKGLNKNLKDISTFGRKGTGERVDGTIGYHSIRSGDISSDHKVMFGLMGERLEITHHAYSFQCFANGATVAALYLNDKKDGMYTMKEILGL